MIMQHLQKCALSDHSLVLNIFPVQFVFSRMLKFLCHLISELTTSLSYHLMFEELGYFIEVPSR